MSDVKIGRITDLGQITLRGDLGSSAFATAIGTPLPGPRRITDGDIRLAWMSPDELLAFCPRDQVSGHVSAVSKALEGQYAIAADVSDARAVFRLTGPEPRLRETLAKLSPADFRPDRLPKGEVRRTRLAQVPAALWFDEGAASVICFRSVATYVEDILRTSARAPVGHF